MKMKLRDRTNLLKIKRINYSKFVPILVFAFILLLTVSIGLADPTTGPPPPK